MVIVQTKEVVIATSTLDLLLASGLVNTMVRSAKVVGDGSVSLEAVQDLVVCAGTLPPPLPRFGPQRSPDGSRPCANPGSKPCVTDPGEPGEGSGL